MSYYHFSGIVYNSDDLVHFGIKGQKWGIRRFQNPDGTLTPQGKARYGTEVEKKAAKDAQRVSDAKAAYGEGAGTRRKLISEEIALKRKDPEYSKAFDEASKYVNVEKSLKRAENLHKNSGRFVRGRDISDRGYTYAKGAAKTIMKAGAAAASMYLSSTIYSDSLKAGLSSLGIRVSDKAIQKAIMTVGGISTAAIVGKGIKDADAYSYYNRNRKF